MKKVNANKNKVAIILAILLIISFKTFVANKMIVVGDSMSDTFKNGDVILVNKLSKNTIGRFDVVVIKANKDSVHGLVIKRVVGLPNETVQIIEGEVYIDGKILEGDDQELMNHSGIAAIPFHLNNDEYFVLGDNRNASSDSRELWLGAVNKNQIIGKPIFRIFPFNKIGRENEK